MAIIFWTIIICGIVAVVGKVALPGGNRERAGTTITRENYDRIQIGMHFDQVEAILGKGWKETSTVGTMQTYIWSEGFRSISITLETNHVAAKLPMNID